MFKLPQEAHQMRRCQRSSLECDGPRETSFIEGTIVKSRRSQKPASARTKQDIEQQDAVVQPIVQAAILSRHNKNEVYICYARKYLHPNGPIDLGLQGLQLTDISTADGKSSANKPVFRHAVLSFATVYFGAQHRQTNILNQGYAMHGAALKQLNKALSDSRCCIRDEVIVSVITLAVLECLVPTGRKNYLKHMLGLERLLELREPDAVAHCSFKTSELYKGVKYMILFASFHAGTPSILARPEWKAVLRVNCSDEELQEQDLCDVLADCTVLVAERDELVPRSDRHVGQRGKLKRKAVSLLAFLCAWKKEWESQEHCISSEESPHLGDWQLSPASSIQDDSRRLPLAFNLKSDAAARMLMLYHTTLIQVLQILASLPHERPEHLEDHSDDTPSPTPWQYFAHEDDDTWKLISNADWAAAKHLAALQVGRCIPAYLNHKRARSDPQFSSQVVQWAVTAAWTALGGDDTAEGRWVTDLLNGRSSQAVAKGLWET
ncbi:Nn.00g059460.m01.CDS01 [Neocucurbitaria sp. VM-36]